MRGAEITVRCDCGGVGYVPYGERWTCPKCRRTWNTTQIPAAEYWAVMRQMRRMRLTVIGVAVALIVPIVALIPVTGPHILILLPLISGFWFIFYMPRWRQRLRQQARNLSKWKLNPE